MNLEQRLRSTLFNALGQETYLSIVSAAYLKIIRAGFLKAKYPELFQLQKIIKPGFVSLDIGANVGYYATFLSDLSGPNGKVLAVEPVPLFAGILKKNLGSNRLKNTEIYPFALGSEEKDITLGTPTINGVFRHGLTKIVNQDEAKTLQTFTAKMKVPDILFKDLIKLDFVKCDVEGYETILFPQMLKTLSRFKPLIQIEINSPENRRELIELLKPLGYQAYCLVNGELVTLKKEEELNWENGDYYFKVA
jgi:FkbM family methyltransferase